jgi:hypothetical protein
MTPTLIAFAGGGVLAALPSARLAAVAAALSSHWGFLQILKNE